MSDRTSYVSFILSGVERTHFALESAMVERLVQLPDLTDIPGAPPYLAGVFNLSGTLIPVVDLGVVLNRPRQSYSLTDSVIVLHCSENPFGILVNEVLDVGIRPHSNIRAVTPSLGGANDSGMIAGALWFDGEIVFLPDSQALACYAEGVQALLDWGRGEFSGIAPTAGPSGPSFHSNTSPREMEVFRERAQNLMQQASDAEQSTSASLVTVGLNGERFGIPVEYVREFCDIRSLAPLPCCPEHIRGNMNLRGGILTVIDIRPILKMPISATPPKKGIVVDYDGLVIGVCVDEIYDLIPAVPDRTARLPVAANSAASEYLKGIVIDGGQILTVVDLPAIFASEALIVNEQF